MKFSKPSSSTSPRTRFLRSRWISAGLACSIALSGALGSGAAYADTPDEQWAFASGLYTQKLWGLAAENLQKFLTANPRHPRAAQASYQLAAAILRADNAGKIDYARGAAAYEKALKEFPDPKLQAPALLELADAYFNLNRHEQAASTYARFLATKPTGNEAAEAAYMRGESLFALKKFEPARAAYAQVLQLGPKSRAAPFAALALGTLAEQAGQNAQAVTAYQKVWRDFPTSEVASEARLRGASALLSLKRWDEARTGFEAVASDPKMSAWKRTALEGAAQAHFGAKRWNEAAAAFERALAEPVPEAQQARGASNADLQLRRADSLFNAREWARAADAYGPLVSSSDASSAALALYFRGRALSESGRKAEAQADLTSFVSRFPRHEKTPRASLLLGDLHSEAGKPALAAQSYRGVIAKFPGSPEAKDAQAALVALANGLVSASAGPSDASPSTSAGASPSTSASSPSDLEAVLGSLGGKEASSAREKLARAAYNKGDWNNAATLAQAALSSSPAGEARENALYLLASSQLNGGRAPQASASFTKLLALKPREEVANLSHLGLASALLDQKKWSEAEAAASAGLARIAATSGTTSGAASTSAGKARSEIRARLLLARGEALWNGKKFAPAAATLSALSASASRDIAAPASNMAALSYESLGKWSEAAAQWSRYAQGAEDPREQARGHLRRALALQKNPRATAAVKTSARASFERALALDAKGEVGAQALYELAWAETEARSPKALARWEQIAGDSTSRWAPTAQFQLGEALFAQKKWREAAEAYALVAQKWPQSEDAPSASYQMGAALFNLEQWREAASSFERAAGFEKSEVAIESLFWAGQSLSKAGDLKSARPFYERFLARASASPSTSGASSTSSTSPATWRSWVTPARLDLARALLEGGDAAGAEKALRAALAQVKGESAAEANFLLARSLWAQSKWKDAAESGLKVSALWANSKWAPESAWIAAQATEKSGSKEAARTLYRAIAEAQPPGQWAAPAQEKLREMGE